MALRSGLGIYLYTAYTPSLPLFVGEYTQQIDSLSFTTLSPGGYGQMSARLNVSFMARWRQEFALFSRVAIVEPSGAAVWLGEIANPTYGMDTNGEYVSIAGLGIGNALRDDPLTLAYVSQTAQQIIKDQLSRRAAYLPIDQDTSAIQADTNTTLSPVYQERTMEDVINDLVQLTGYNPVLGQVTDYIWGVWAHPRNRDVAGFPTGQLCVHPRDVSTLSYIASLSQGDLTGYRVTPAAERAYNVTAVDYLDPTTGIAGTQTYTDPRLNGDGSQGSAPFRRRKYVRNLRGVQTATSADALNIANAYGPQMQNPSAKTVLTLGTARDPNGAEIPLWRVAADSNILVPEFATQAQTFGRLSQPGHTVFVTPPTPAEVGVSQFYIVQTTYSESKSSYSVEVQCDNYADDGAVMVARLQEQADEKSRQGQQTTGIVQASGAGMRGRYGWRFSNGVAGQSVGGDETFPAIAINAPTSLTLTSIASSNVGAISVSNITTLGATFSAGVNANGAGFASGTYQTNGNCLLHVDSEGGRLAKHCDGCRQVSRDLGIEQHARLDTTWGATPGQSALAVACPVCGMVEAFNTNLTAADEAHAWGWRAEQSRYIRRLMATLGMTLR
jgi:hypothetical protein